MSKFYVRDEEQARFIVRAYDKCGVCADCPLHVPEGWRCGHLYDRAQAYLASHELADVSA